MNRDAEKATERHQGKRHFRAFIIDDASMSAYLRHVWDAGVPPANEEGQ
jgi:hypothetical protein